jgi:hypothetical protein
MDNKHGAIPSPLLYLLEHCCARLVQRPRMPADLEISTFHGGKHVLRTGIWS